MSCTTVSWYVASCALLHIHELTRLRVVRTVNITMQRAQRIAGTCVCGFYVVDRRSGREVMGQVATLDAQFGNPTFVDSGRGLRRARVVV